MDTGVPGYSHTQKSLLCLMVYGTAIALLVGAWFTHDEFPIAMILGGSGVLTLILAMAFHHLAVVDEGDRLAIRFGPLPLFRRTVQYADIEKVEIGRTLIPDGWGIHLSIRGGWVWNLWGRDCIVVHLRKGALRIGTDDASNLARFLEGKIVQQGQ
jgi:hypothetical protein